MSTPIPPLDDPARTRPLERAALVFLTLAAFGLRAWGIGYGIPEPWTRPDEYRWVGISLGLLENPDPRWFQWPTLHAYLLAAVYWVWGQFRVWRGDFPRFHAFLNEDMYVYTADLVLLGRMVSTVIGAAVVPLTWKLGEKVGPRGTGLLAAVLMAVAFGPARDAHWALIEPLLLLGIVATLLATVWAMERPTLLRFAIAGLLAGLDTSAKYSGASLCVPIALAVVVCRHREGKPVVGALWDARGWIAAAAMAAGFIGGSPYILVSRAQFAAAMEIREWSYRDASFGTEVGFIHHLLFSMRHSHGLLGEAVGLAGLLFLGWRTGPMAVITVYGIATYVGLGPARIIPMRYASSLAPCIVIGAAWAILELVRRSPRRAAWATALALVLAVDPAWRCFQFDRLLTREDTRHTARVWLLAHYPAGGSILIPDSKALRWGRPYLEDRYHVVPYKPRLARLKTTPYALLAESDTGYIPFSPETHDVLRASGTLAALFDPFAPGARPVYDPHDAFFVPVAGFDGVAQPGPRISIYQLRPVTWRDTPPLDHPLP